MRNISILVFCFGLFSSCALQAQNKYAVLVGINDYYQSPGVMHPSSLHGCVNDAKAVEELLLNRFGFKPSNVYTLFDSASTRPAVLHLMRSVLSKATKGDAFVFYYSGHGAWMKNEMELDSLKRQMSQAMVMSDLYAPGLGCLLTDEDLKTVFNEFVDKKIITTALLDCCYSGFLLAAPPPPAYWWPTPREGQQKSINLSDISYIPNLKKPIGCPVDSPERTLADTDGDGVPDCRDWEINSLPGVQVDSLGVAKEFIGAEEYIIQTKTDPRFVGYTAHSSLVEAESRAFNLRDALTVNFAPKAERPADRKGSAFISLAASSQYQKAAEITDENGIRHGAFTKAMLSIYQSNSSALPVSELMAKLTSTLKEQHYEQEPTFLFEKSRLKGNLIGTNSKSFSNTVALKCTAVANRKVTLDKGLYAGIAKGNVLRSATGNKTLTVDSATATESIATDKTGAVRKGTIFRVVDGYTSSAPLAKVYIPEVAFTQKTFAAFFQKRIKPVVAQSTYADYYDPAFMRPQTVHIYTDPNKYVVQNSTDVSPEMRWIDTLVLLPLPSYVTKALKKKLEKNQNIKLVKTAAEADYVLYLNYAKRRNGNPSGFVFYYHPPLAEMPWPIFSSDYVLKPALPSNEKGLRDLCEKLYGLAVKTLRYNTGDVWMNEQPKKSTAVIR